MLKSEKEWKRLPPACFPKLAGIANDGPARVCRAPIDPSVLICARRGKPRNNSIAKHDRRSAFPDISEIIICEARDAQIFQPCSWTARSRLAVSLPGLPPPP